MGAKTLPLEQLLKELSNSQSGKRRAAAKHLRKLKNPSAGRAIESALRKEVQDSRTWETQYQMIMALAESEYKPAIPLLLDLSRKKLAYMICVAIGDALIRLSSDHEKELVRVLSNDEMGLTDGALRAIAMLRHELSPQAIGSVIDLVRKPENEQLRFWVAAAAPGWSGRKVHLFLQDCCRSRSPETRKAAQAALEKKYLRWNPL